MLPVTLVLVQNIAGAFMAIGLRRLAKILPKAQFQVLAVVFVCMYALTLPVVLAMGNVSLAALTVYWPQLLVAGITLTLSPICLYMALRYMDVAMASLLSTINIIIAILGAVWLLDERLTAQQVLGAVIVVAAIIYALSVRLTKKQRKHWVWGAGFTFLSGLFLAITLLLEKYLLDFMSAESLVVWSWGIQTALAVLLGVLIRRHHFADIFHRRAWPHLLATGLSKAAAVGGFIASMVVFRSLSLTIVLAGLRPLFVSFLGALLLKEHEFLRRKIAASVIAALGVGVMFI